MGLTFGRPHPSGHFGRNARNFRDIVAAMLTHDAVVVVANQDDLIQFVRSCLEKPQNAAAMGQRARELVLRQLWSNRADFSAIDRTGRISAAIGNQAPTGCASRSDAATVAVGFNPPSMKPSRRLVA